VTTSKKLSIELRPELAKRIVWEAHAVELKFPGRFCLKRNGQGPLRWSGCVPVEGHDVPISVTYPDSYPASPPILRTTVSLPEHCPHLLGRSGSETTICWIAVGARDQRRRWDPQVHTAATVMRAAQRWFLAYLVWSTLGKWPVPDAWDAMLRQP